MTIPAGFLATDVRSRLLQALLGQWAYSDPLNDSFSVLNSDPQAVQVDTVTVDTGTNSHEYTLEVEGIEVSYTADSSTSTTEVATGLAAAWNDSAGGDYAYATSSTNVVTLTGTTPGLSYTIDQVDALMTLASVTAAAEADAIPFGRLMIAPSAAYETDESNALGVLCKAAKLTAQVDTLAVTYAASEVYKIRITIEGETYDADVDANTDSNTTATDIRTAINAMMPANTVNAAGSNASVTLTAEVAGKAFVAAVSVKSETVARLTLTHTTATALTDVNRAVLGISLRSSFVESTTIGDSTPSWPANQGVEVARKGAVWVSNSQSPVRGDKVYVETGVTADNGKLFNTTSATRILLTGAKWERAERSTNSSNLAIVRFAF